MARWVTGFRLSGYGAAYFFAAGAFMSYWPVWLRDRGMTDSQIGTLFMSRQLVSVLSTLAIGWAAHRLGNVRGVILVLAGAATFLLTGYQFSYTFLAILLVSLVWGGVWAPTMALYDGILVNETRARGFNYGSLRVWSSVAFIAGAVICGVMVDRNGPAWVLYVAFAGIVMLVPLGLLLPAAETQHREAGKHAPFGILDLLASRPFLLFMLAAGCCQASHAVLYSFGTLTWRAAGLSDVTISLLWAESVAVEILLMLGSGWLLARLGATGLIGLGLLCAMVRWLGMAFTTELWALVLLQALACRQLRRLPPRRHGLHPARPAGLRFGAGPERLLCAGHRRHPGAGVPARRRSLQRRRAEGVSRHVRRQRHRHGGAGRAGTHLEGRAAGRRAIGLEHVSIGWNQRERTVVL